MIVVRVELWSAITGNKTEIARLDISNVGGTDTLGDYRARAYRGRSAKALDNAMRRASVVRFGAVTRYPRKKLHVWNLVAASLAAMNYGAKTNGKAKEAQTPSRQRVSSPIPG